MPQTAFRLSAGKSIVNSFYYSKYFTDSRQGCPEPAENRYQSRLLAIKHAKLGFAHFDLTGILQFSKSRL